MALLSANMLTLSSIASAQQMYNGSTGYINTPSAHMRADGTMDVGLSQATPYLGIYGALQALPGVEITGRYQQTTGVPDFVGVKGANFGSFKDKSIGFKVRVLNEFDHKDKYLPSLAIGIDDVGIGTQTFKSTYLVASKSIAHSLGKLDMSVGYGQNRIKGAFGGLRFSPEKYPQWSAVVDYDHINFRNDVGASLVGLDQRPIGRMNAALEFKGQGGWAVQMGMRDGKPGINISMTAPFGRRALTAKSPENDPYVSFSPRPQVWRRGQAELVSVANALYAEGFRQAHLTEQDNVIQARLSSQKFIQTNMAAGRAMRILLAHAPANAKKISLTLLQESMPTLVYTAHDLQALQAYFAGRLAHQEILRTVEVKAEDGSSVPAKNDSKTTSPSDYFISDNLLTDSLLASSFEELKLKLTQNLTGLSFDRSVGQEYLGGSQWRAAPTLEVYFNDPSGALKLSAALAATGKVQISPGLSLDAAASVTLLENISDVSQPNNSLLPNVRTNITDYYRNGRVKLRKLLLNQYWKPADQVYGRVSAGIYELMYSGVGGQLLYVPKEAGWYADTSIDYLAQRDPASTFKLNNYRTLSGFVSGHVRLPYDMTATVRAGRFLAKDRGFRFELKREFESGAQFGAWLSTTNLKDTTSPGSIANPYLDKGIFMSIPFDVFSTRNTGRVMDISISPWTRDVAQMVKSPMDLAVMIERSLINGLHHGKSLRGFSGMDVDDR